jgi:uncharacterized protein DUF1559
MDEFRPVPETIEHRDLRRKQFGCICVLLGLMAMSLVGAVYVCLFRTVPLRISTETTWITEPLKSDGKQVDYFTAWERQTYPEDIATEKNGYRLIVQHLGTAPEAEPWQTDQISRKLGLAREEIRLDMTFEEPVDFLQHYVASKDFDQALIEELASDDASPMAPYMVLEDRLSRPWTLDDLPMMEAWLAENGPAIDLIGEAVRKPTFYIPFAQEDEAGQLFALPLPEIPRTRSFVRALSARANYRIATGDIDGALDDIISCKRLGRHVGQRAMIIDMLVGIAIEGIADGIGIAGSLEHPPSKEQLERLVDESNDLPPEADFEHALLFERYVALDVVQAIARGKNPMDFDLPATLPAGLGVDWNVIARRVNEHYDTILTTGGSAMPFWNLNGVVSPHARSELVGDKFATLLLPAWDAAREASRRNVCVDRMQEIALAMLLYDRDHGTLPPAYTVDADGRPMHSWRVLLLPYLGQEEFHGNIRLDEPWDSEHNQQFHNAAVPFYQCPSAGLTPGHTTYSVVVGPQMPFGAGQGKSLSKFGPKSARMILVVERLKIACWMDPTQDLPQAAAEDGFGVPEGIGSQHPGLANAAHRDGAARFLSEQIDTEQLKGLLQGTTDRIP